MDMLEQIEQLFERHRAVGPRSAVSPCAHALQCAQLAEWAHADESLVAAALLHDIGHLIPRPASLDAADDVHELRAVAFLGGHFDAAVIEPIRLHVQAKRYLVALDPRYRADLAADARQSLQRQGGAMAADERRWFESLPGSGPAVALRRWDDLAREPARRTPPLAHYLRVLEAIQIKRTASATALAAFTLP